MDNTKLLLEKANRLPLLPGVYIMLDASGAVIYVGKAKKLKNRVSSYFHGDHLPKVAAMVAKVQDFQVIVAESEFEALVLENSLIKRHKPHYNILLKDDKGYPFIRLDRKAPYPRMEIASRAEKDGADYYGPFGGRSRTREIIDAISAALLLPDCARVFPRDVGKERPCLNYHMGKCAGWCLRDADPADYLVRTGQAALILAGKSDELITELRGKMESAAEELRFERAAELRDRIRAIEGLQNRQRVIATAFADTDAVGFRRGAKSCFTVLHFSGGDLASKDLEILDWMLEIAEDDFYKKAVPGFDWRYFKFRVLEYYMQNTEMNNYRGFSDEQLKAICKKADEMNYVCQNTPDYYREIIGYSTLPILIARCRYLGGEIDKKLYLEMLMQSYKKRDRLTFSTDGCFYNMLVPLEIICQMNPYELNMEEVSLLEEIYDNICAYIFRFAGDSALSFELENVSEIIRRYIEVPSGVLFKDFVLQIIAAIHPPTYIHSQMVGQLTECFCYHLINKNPEIFVGMPGIENVDDVYKKRSHIVDYAYNAALCHDFGKAFIMDTIFVYGRRLLDFEFDIIKAHPEVGYMLLSNNESTRKYADVARGHHKWYDDTKGYPENVKTVDSPYKVIIDIVQCADCMDAATDSVGRSYNQGKTLANFIKEIKADSGSRYAPFLAPLFDDPMVYQDVEYLLDEQRAKNYERTYSLLREVKDKG
ncbi:MAG: UvrB/UvrC motif-containing protein [Lachnospiraceae bacterium]|nr:UvrB/UvrC motif-containing protein [Lachnospiraceae bacterium]